MKGKEELRTPASLRILRRKALAFALAFALVFSTMMSMIPVLKVKATVNYADYVNTTNSVEFNGNDWYIIEYDSTAETVTLLSKECVGASVFSNSNNVNYDNSDLKIYLADYYNNTFPSDGKTAIVDRELYIPSKAEVDAITEDVRKCTNLGGEVSNIWWLSTPDPDPYGGLFVVTNKNGTIISISSIDEVCGVRPALKLDLSAVTFESGTFTVGASQSNEEVTWEYPTSKPDTPFAGGDGSEDNPYLISNAQELANMAYLSSRDYAVATNDYDYYFEKKYYKLTQDINLGEKSWNIQIGNNGFFLGSFDGAGHTISGLNIESSGDDVGLFSKITNGAIIENLTVKGTIKSTGSHYRIGGIVGCNVGSASIINCVNECNIDSAGIYVGGIIGADNGNSDSISVNIINCTNKGNITGSNQVGGIYGGSTSSSAGVSSSISNSDNQGNITATNGYVGGICYNFRGTIEGCYNSGTIRGTNVGGIVAENYGTVNRCYNEGELVPSSGAGGIARSNNSGSSIQNCYNSGDNNEAISGTYVGGIAGSNGGSISKCYNSGIFSSGGGIVGTNSNSISNTYCLNDKASALTGNGSSLADSNKFLSEEEFRNQENFTGFDFESVWTMNAEGTYPVLQVTGGVTEHTVTFDSNGGSPVESQTIEDGDTASQPSDPTKSGCVFSGWYLEGASEPFDFSTAIISDITLTAKWLTIMTDVSCNNYADAYDGESHGIEVTAPSGATVKYGTETGNYTSNKCPTYKDVGEYTVYYQVSKEGYATVTGSATITITQKEVEISWTNTSLTYNGSNQKPTATSSDIINGDYCSIVVSGEQKDANSGTSTYTATATLEGGSSSNYKIKDSDKTTTFTIGKKDIVISGIKANNKTYNGNTDAVLDYGTVVFDGIINGDNLTVTATGTFSDANAGDGKNVNISNLALSGDSVGNYKLAENGQQTTTTANISKDGIEASADDITTTYADNSTQKIAVNVTTPATGYTITYKTSTDEEYSAANPEFYSVGTYTVYYKVSCENYNDLEGSATITINEATFESGSITANGYSGAYDGNEHGIEVSVSGVSGATIKYSETENGTYKTTPIKYKDVTGSAKTVYYKVEKTGYTTVTGSATVSITPKAVTVTPADNQKKTYGEADPASYTYTAEGLVSGESLSGRLTREDGTDAREYAFSIGTLDSANSNYSVSLATGDIPKFVIEPKEIGITWGTTEFTYDKTAKCPTATVTAGSLIEGDTCDITVTGEQINAGDNYTATASITNTNYKLPTNNTTTFNIKPAKIIVSGIKANNKAYDGNISASLDYSNVSLDGKIAGDDLFVSATGAFEDYKPAPDITVSITDLTLEGTSAGNYVLATLGQQTTTTADITINNDIVVEEVTNPDGSITKTETKYEGGNVSKITETTTSADGNTVTVVEKNASDETLKTTVTVNNADGTKTITETNADESSKVTEKDSAGNIMKETVTNSDGSKVVTENSYDNLGNKTGSVVTTISADGKTVTVETKDNNEITTKTVKTVTNADETKTVTTTEGNTTTVETKDSQGNVIKTVETVTNTDGSTTVTVKNSSNKITKVTVTNADGSKVVTENSYDNAGDKTGSVVTTTSADGKTVTVEEKDASDNIKKTTVTEKDESDTVVKTTVTVNNSDGTKTITQTNVDGSSKVTEKDYDGNITKETVTNADRSKVVTENSYDSEGNKTGSVVTTTSSDGKTVTVEEKDVFDNITKTTVTEKDASDNVVKTIVTVNNADGTKTITETNADGSSKLTEEDSAGNTTRETVTNADGSKEVTENSYDNAGDKTGSVVTTTSADGKTVTVEEKDASDVATKTTETVTNADGTKTVTTTEGNTTTVETKDSEGNTTGSTVTTTSENGKTVTVETKDSEGNTTKTVQTVTNSDGAKTVTTTDGNTTTVETFDNSGETTSVIRQESNDQGTAVKAVEEIGEAPDTILNDEVDELVDKLISDEEKVRQQNGELVMIVLDVEDVTDTVSSEDIAKVAAILQNGEKAGGYFEINLYKQIGSSERIQITDTNSEKISISMRIPDELLNHDDNVERTYYIARLHDGKAEIIDSTTDLVKQLITFETDKFSIYAITYIDKVITNQNTNTTDTSNTQDKPNNTDPTSTPNSQVDKDNQNAAPAEVKTPDNANNADNKSSEQTKVSKDNNALSTGDKMHLGIVIMLMIDSCLAALYLTLKKRLR